jgi:hypothetical protein
MHILEHLLFSSAFFAQSISAFPNPFHKDDPVSRFELPHPETSSVDGGPLLDKRTTPGTWYTLGGTSHGEVSVVS